MNRNNNVRIALAIIAMFIIALSIIGVTYAYFTARISGNTTTKSVTVQAGKLEVTYQTSNVINAQGIVPGWISDGRHYFDPTKRDTSGHIVAQEVGVTSGVDSVSDIPTSYKTAAYGYHLPAKFTVKNTGTNTAYYGIKLINITNQIGQIGSNNDQDNVVVKIYKGTYDGSAALDEAKIVYNDKLGSGSSKNTNAVFKVEPNNTNNLYLVLEYNNANYDQSQNMGKNVSLTVQVVGVAEDPQGTNWIDANGATYVAKNNMASGSPFTLGNNNS